MLNDLKDFIIFSLYVTLENGILLNIITVTNMIGSMIVAQQ